MEDVLQETYLRAYAFLSEQKFRDEASLDTWLYRITTNASIDLLRRRRTRSAVPLADAIAGGRGAPAEIEARADLARLDRFIAELPIDQRTALVLKELEELSGAEIAKVLGCSEGAVEQRLVRARAALRRRIEGG